MRKILGMVVLVLALCVCQAHAKETTVSKTPILTGEIWLKTSSDEKLAFLFGVDTVIAIEYTIEVDLRERKTDGANPRRRHPVLSRFERGWLRALKDVPRKELIATIDTWYQQHEDSLDRPVMDFIWRDIIEPRLAELKAKKK